MAEVLVSQGVLGQDGLLKALALQRHQDLPIGEILMAQGEIDEAQLMAGLAAQYGARIVDLEVEPADPELADTLDAKTAIELSALPWRRVGTALIVVTNRPDRAAEIRRALTSDGPVMIALAGRAEMQAALTLTYGARLARLAEARVPLANSCRDWNAKRLSLILLFVCAALVQLAMAFPITAAVLAFGGATLVFLCNTALKAAAFAGALRRPVPAEALDQAPPLRLRTPPPPVPIRRQPVVTLLVPLYRERDIAGQLVERLTRLDYPPELLDVLLILEADDDTTARALKAADLPAWMRAITVPDGRPRTKPRALNYALNFARGSIIGIYDAEDRPEPDQIRKVVRRFAEAPKELACLQGRLDYYNATHNWISRCFTIEYASWFRVMLPGVQNLGLFVPLSGTTLFLRRTALEDVGGWDAHNVTEDAELGLRLVRGGYRTEILRTTTYEEANSALWPWIRQRSRWLKGYAMTWASHMRDPGGLRAALGGRAYWGFQLQILGTVLGFLSAPLLWSFVVVPFGVSHPLDAVLTPVGYGVLGLIFVAALCLTLCIAFVACRAPHLRRHRVWLPLLVVYFPLGSLAALVALGEMALRPFYWAKTAHGRFSYSARTVAQPVEAGRPDPSG